MADRLPNQAELDRALRDAAALRISDGNTDRKRRRRKADFFATSDAAEVKELVALLRVDAGGSEYCDIPGSMGPALEFRDHAGRVIATLVIGEGPQLHWFDRWDAAPYFLDFAPVRAWLTARGVPIGY